MAFEKITRLDRIEVVANCCLQVRYVTQVLEDGRPLGDGQYLRCAYAPGDDVSHEDEWIKKIAEALWNPELIEKYRTNQPVR